MPWYLYLALKQLFPSGKFVSFYTAISIIGVSLGVMLMIIAPGVMGGFGRQIQKMVIDTQGEVQVRARGFIADPKAAIDAIGKVPGVTGATAYSEGVAIVEFERKPAFPMIRGIDLNTVRNVLPIDRYIIAGSVDDLDDDSVILSSQLALSLGARVGSKVEVYSPLLLERLKNDEVMLARELRVAGIFQINHQQLDSSLVFTTLRQMQELYGMGNAVHGLNVKLGAGLDADEAARRISDAVQAVAPGAVASSWRESNADFLWIVQLEKNLILFLLLFVVIVAMFMVTSLLLVLVTKKTREIGLLSALGGQTRHISLCFAAQGVFIGVVGILGGLALGFTVLEFRNEIVKGITYLTGGEQALVQFYQFSQLPAHTEPRDLALTICATLLFSVLAGLLPAWRAARLKPVEALRNE